MNYSFHIQDPTSTKTVYFYEALIEQLERSEIDSWQGIFAFATGGAINSLFVEDPIVENFIKAKSVNLVIGIDAVTDYKALALLVKLSKKYPLFNAKVFFNPSLGLFHPKVSLFEGKNGFFTIIVGSGNLTPGGLRNNIEAYIKITGKEDVPYAIDVWNDFFERHSENIRDIGEEALKRVQQNLIRPKVKKLVAGKTELRMVETREDIEEDKQIIIKRQREKDRTLIAQVPAAGGRWHQVHYNKDVIRKFFKIKPYSAQRVFLQEVKIDGTLGEEEIRPLVLSKRNLNPKIEVVARRESDYPKSPPVIILREIGLRTFRYMLLLPGDLHYRQMLEMTISEKPLGKGLPRVLTTFEKVLSLWESCPL